MFKKMIGVFLTCILCSITLASCSDTTNIENKNNNNETTTVTLGIWQGNDQEQEALDEVLALIEAQKNIKVEKKIYTDYETQLKTDIAAKVAPDVFYVDSLLFPELEFSGVLSSIPENILQEANVDDFHSNIIDAFSTDKYIYGFPKDFSVLGVFYNDNLLRNAGFTGDDIPENFEDWPVFLGKLQSKLPDGVTALSVNPELPRFLSLLETQGITINNDDYTANLNAPEIVEAVDFIGQLYQEGSTKSPAQIGNDWVGDSMGLQKAAITMEGNWIIGHLNKNFPEVKYATKEMPKYNGKNNTLAFTVAYGVAESSKNKEVAHEVAMLLTNPENMSIWCTKAGVLPVRTSVSEQMQLSEDAIQGPLMQGIAYAQSWQRGMSLSVINREFNNWFPKITTNEMTAQEAMNEATIAANQDIDDFMQ